MRICLSMIVRNESAVIERCLRSVRPFIDAWAISDTGSSDGTQERVRSLMGELPGELIERPWVDFATNRNHVLELAREFGDYALIIDADEVLETDAGFSWGSLYAAGYGLEFVFGASRFPRLALPRLDAGWRWDGVLHETLVRPGVTDLEVLAGVRIQVHSDGARSRLPLAEKFSRDAEVLRKALRAEPDNARYAFYLAQSLRDAGRTGEAVAAYHARVAMGGWDEEVYFSKLQIGVLKERLGAEPAEIEAAYVEAINYRPARAEALCELARHLRMTQRLQLARQFALRAASLPLPDASIVDRTVYDWRARDELALAAFGCGDRAESMRLLRQLLSDARLPDSEHVRVAANLEAITKAGQ